MLRGGRQILRGRCRTDVEEQGAGAGTLITARGAGRRAVQYEAAGWHRRGLLHRQHLRWGAGLDDTRHVVEAAVVRPSTRAPPSNQHETGSSG